MCILLLPLILVNFIRNLKYLAPFSTFALVSTVLAFGVVLSYVFADLPPVTNREPVGDIFNFPLFFGTVIFALEAIGVVSQVKKETLEEQLDKLHAHSILGKGVYINHKLQKEMLVCALEVGVCPA